MTIHISDGYYLARLRDLKFKEDRVEIPVGSIKGQVLAFTVASKEHLSFLKKNYAKTEKTMSYRISKNHITWIEDLESIEEKLFPGAKEKKKALTPKLPKKVESKKQPKTKQVKKPKESPGRRFNPPIEMPYPTLKSHVEKIERLPPTLQNVARFFSSFPSEINRLLNRRGYASLTVDSLLSKTQFKWLSQNFRMDKVRKHNRIENLNYVWTEFGDYPDPLPREAPINPAPIPKPKPEQVRQIALTRDAFTSVVQNIEYPGLPVIYSYFQDIQARLICSRMCSSFARSIAGQHSRSSAEDDKDILVYQLHAMSNKALQVFGGKILTLIYELPPLRFAQKTALEVTTYKKVRPDFPLISFSSEKQGQVNIAFFTKLHRDQKTLRPHVILFRHETYQTIGSIDELGHIRLQLEAFRPRLSLFIDQINEKKFKIYSGVQTGICDICKRPLSEPLSLRIGIGPVCAKKIGLDRSVYDY